MKVIVFNSPAGSGKDDAVELLTKNRVVIPFSFKRTLKKITLAIYDIEEKVWDSWYSRDGKELPRTELNGLSCRQVLIKVSEEIVKPAFGKDFFGVRESGYIARVHKQSGINVSASSDGGFPEEIIPLIKEFGVENIFIIRIERPGCTFAGDSRNWISLEEIPDDQYFTIHNDGTLEEFHTNILDVFDFITK